MSNGQVSRDETPSKPCKVTKKTSSAILRRNHELVISTTRGAQGAAEMRAWHTHDISVSRDFVFGKVRARVLAEVNNLLSQDYDVILNYPMPKRNFRFTFTVEI